MFVSELGPPAPNARNRKGGSIMTDTKVEPALVVGQIIDPLRSRLPQFLVDKVMDIDGLRLPFRSPSATRILAVAHQLPFR